MNDQCPSSNTCQLYKGHFFLQEDSVLLYKRQYCLDNNEQRWKGCKRFIVMAHIGYCPDYVLPNSLLSYEQIISRIRSENPLIC